MFYFTTRSKQTHTHTYMFTFKPRRIPISRKRRVMVTIIYTHIYFAIPMTTKMIGMQLLKNDNNNNEICGIIIEMPIALKIFVR